VDYSLFFCAKVSSEKARRRSHKRRICEEFLHLLHAEAADEEYFGGHREDVLRGMVISVLSPLP